MSVVFAFPFNAPSLQVQVRDPDLANITRTESEATIKMAMDGTLYSKRRSTQPTVLSWTFHALTRAKAEELQNFFQASAGQTILLIDFEGTSWAGQVVSPKFDFDTNETGLSPYGSVRPEYSTVKLEFQGAPL